MMYGGDRQTLTPSNHRVSNSTLHRNQRWVMNYAPTVFLGGVGNSVAGSEIYDSPQQVIPTPSHLLDRISPIFPPFFLVFCAFSPSRRGGSKEPQAGIQGQETAGKGTKSSELRPSFDTPGAVGRITWLQPIVLADLRFHTAGGCRRASAWIMARSDLTEVSC